MSSLLLAQLAALCRAHPLELKVVFVPSAQAVQNLEAALAARGPAWANLRLVTPAEWAEYWAGPLLQTQGWRPLSQDEEFFMVWETLGVAGRTRALGSADRPSPGLARSLVQALRILRLNGVSPEALAALNPGAERLQTLADLYREYAAALEKRKWYDQAILLVRAREQVRRSKAIVAVCDELLLPELSFQFVQSCIESGAYRLGWGSPLAEPPAPSARARFAALPQPPLPESWEAEVCQRQICRATGAEAEVRHVLRAVLRNQIPMDQVELVYTAEQPYLSLVHSLAEEFGLEVDAGQGIPVYFSQVGQALLGFYRWVGSGFNLVELSELCRAGLIRTFPQTTGPAHLLAPFLRRTQAQAEFGEGEHEGMLPTKNTSTNNSVLRAQELLGKLKALVPEGPEIALGALAQAGIEFLQHFALPGREHDPQVVDPLVEGLEALATMELVDTPSRLAQRLLDRLGAHQLRGSCARAGHLLVSPLESAGYTGRKYLYIIGMDEGAFSGKATEDPLLNDGERLRLGLPLQRNRPGEQVWHLSRVLAAAGGHLTLVAKRCELQDGRELSPAPLLQRLAEHGRLEDIPLVLSDPGEALDEGEAVLASCLGQKGVGQAQALFPWLAEGERACLEREHPILGHFSGWLGRLTPELGINRGRLLRSASSLESLMRCPYSYFLRYVLELQSPADREEDPSRWLSPAALGSALHLLFYRFMSKLKERGEQPSLEKHHQLMKEMLRELVAELKERTPVRRESAFRADLRRLERSAAIFLKVEDRDQHIEKVDFELSFGLPKQEDSPFGEGVVVDLSDRVQLRLQGRIDRVDRQGEAYEIWDYKTGSSVPYEGEDLLRGGIHLQWALYAYALEQVLQHRESAGCVASSGYFFVGAREHGRRLSALPLDRTVLANCMGPVVDLVERGGFFHIQKEKQCTYCDFAALCAGEERLPGDLEPEMALPGQPEIAALLRQWADG